MSRTFAPVDPGISEIHAVCRIWTIAGIGRGAWLRLFGEHASASDARWIQWRVEEAAALAKPAGILVDVTQLELRSSDPFSIRSDARYPVVLAVARPDQLSILEPFLRESLRTDLDAAIDELETLLPTAVPYERKGYLWTEVWSDPSGELRLLRAASDGSFDVFDPATRRRPLQSFPTELAATDYLGAFHRVEGRVMLPG